MMAHRGAAFVWAILHLGLAALFLVGARDFYRSVDHFWSVEMLLLCLSVGMALGQLDKASRLKSISIYGKEPTQ